MSSYNTTFAGTEATLDESGKWFSGPGAWVDMRKADGAYPKTPGTGTYHAAMLLSPTIGNAQYSEITGTGVPATNDWYSVMCRMQSSSDGSCYLCIVYQGTLRLYKTTDSGSLGFSQLGSNVSITVASPYRLRMEVINTADITVYWNSVSQITQTDSSSPFTSGQPAFGEYRQDADSVISFFDGGDIGGAPKSLFPSRSNLRHLDHLLIR